MISYFGGFEGVRSDDLKWLQLVLQQSEKTMSDLVYELSSMVQQR
jgi:hypothetical protein